MTELERITATLAIHELKARYFRTMDTKDWDGLETVFAADLIADFREAAGDPNENMVTHGAKLYISKLAPILQNVTTVHHGHMPEIVIEDDNSARGIWAMEDKLWVGHNSELPFRYMHGYGHYHEKYVCLADGWRIKEIRLSRLRVDVE